MCRWKGQKRVPKKLKRKCGADRFVLRLAEQPTAHIGESE